MNWFQEMEKRLSAEVNANSAANSRADSAIASRNALENQVEELKFAHDSVLDTRNRLEKELSEKGKLENSLREELQEAKDPDKTEIESVMRMKDLNNYQLKLNFYVHN